MVIANNTLFENSASRMHFTEAYSISLNPGPILMKMSAIESSQSAAYSWLFAEK